MNKPNTAAMMTMVPITLFSIQMPFTSKRDLSLAMPFDSANHRPEPR